MSRLADAHWICVLSTLALLAALWRMRTLVRVQAAERRRERRMREELEAYAHLDVALGHSAGEDPVESNRALSKRVCRVVGEHSAFSRAALLLRDVEGRLYCAGSTGIDDLTVKALDGWAQQVVEEERSGDGGAAGGKSVRAGAKSFTIPLGEWSRFDREVSPRQIEGKRERRRWRRGIIAPVRISTGRMMGAIAVCADGTREGAPQGLERAMGPIESLAARLGTSIENAALTDRLLRAEKLAGLGQLAGGVAHALNNPLTAVLGFAELIGETAIEARVRKDADTIRAEALKMKETVQRLTEFWRPVTLSDEAVELPGILTELSAACRAKLEERAVQLLLTVTEGVPPVRGSHDRLRQVMEHLLNNSAQAIAAAGPRPEEDGAHAIRVTVSYDERALHVIVSDTGPGFREPGRVFDPFYTTKGPEQGAGLGLSICYGIVREHGGEISAFNLHPHGAAVVVELPLRRVVRGEAMAITLVKDVA